MATLDAATGKSPLISEGGGNSYVVIAVEHCYH
jgi:hypothetical protein